MTYRLERPVLQAPISEEWLRLDHETVLLPERTLPEQEQLSLFLQQLGAWLGQRLQTLLEGVEDRERVALLAPSKEVAETLAGLLQAELPSPVVGMEYVEAEWSSDGERLRNERRRELEDEYAVLSVVITTDPNSDLFSLPVIRTLVLCTHLLPDEANELAQTLISRVAQGDQLCFIDVAANAALLRPIKYVTDEASRASKPQAPQAPQPPQSPAVPSRPQPTQQRPQQPLSQTQERLPRMPVHVIEGAVHLLWEGPFYLEELTAFDTLPVDQGVFQIYGAHPTYGDKALLQIGTACDKSFCQAIAEEAWAQREDAASIHFYVGRWIGDEAPSTEAWRGAIEAATLLLIEAHQPAYNQVVTSTGDAGVHVMNWGTKGALLREVSALRWRMAASITEHYRPYGTH